MTALPAVLTGLLQRCGVWWLLAALWSGAAAAQATNAPLLLDAESADRLDLRPFLAVWQDASGALSAAQVRAAGPRFAALPPGTGLNLGYQRGTAWLRLTLVSRLARDSDWRLELDYASLDHASLFFPDGSAQHSGDRIALSARSVHHRNPVFRVALPAGATVELLLSARSEGSLTLNPLLWRADAFAAHSASSYAAHALYFGMLLALAGYNLLLFVALRDRAFGYYVLFVLGVGIGIASIYGLAGQYLWPQAVDWSNRALVVSFALAGVVGPLFARDFLHTRMHAPRWHRALAIGAIVHVGMVAVGLWSPLRFGMQAMSVTTLLNCVLMLGCGFSCLWRRAPGAGLFVLAWLVLLLGGAVMALRNFGLLPTHFLTLHGMQIGSALEMLLLSFALAGRFNQIKQEKALAQAESLAAQQQLVESLKAHERELEQRVHERTEALAAANTQLKDLALKDPLTGLANRSALYARLDQVLADASNGGPPVCALLVDLDGFKAVNDRLGHAAGDLVLVEVAAHLRAVTRTQDLVARLGGDEFVIVAACVAPPEPALEATAERLRSALSAPLLAAPSARIGASIGIAIAAAGEDASSLLRRADQAMYAAKADGRGGVRWARD